MHTLVGEISPAFRELCRARVPRSIVFADGAMLGAIDGAVDGVADGTRVLMVSVKVSVLPVPGLGVMLGRDIQSKVSALDEFGVLYRTWKVESFKIK